LQISILKGEGGPPKVHHRVQVEQSVVLLVDTAVFQNTHWVVRKQFVRRLVDHDCRGYIPEIGRHHIPG
jgi:hypothetical protein